MKLQYDLQDIETLVSDRSKFEEFVYTPIDRAITEIKQRKSDEILELRVSKILKNDVPKIFIDHTNAVIFRQIATPNYEIRRFVNLVDFLSGFNLLFFEFHQDKFTSNNEYKHSLGQLRFFDGYGKKGGAKIERVNIIDFNSCNGKTFSDIRTLWNESLISFHKRFFKETYISLKRDNYFEASNWLQKHGSSAKDYYIDFLALFVRHSILFENFLLDEKEVDFSRKVFLPAFINVYKKTGKKPLVVALEPTESETDEFWICHPKSSKNFLSLKQKNFDKFLYSSVFYR